MAATPVYPTAPFKSALAPAPGNPRWTGAQGPTGIPTIAAQQGAFTRMKAGLPALPPVSQLFHRTRNPNKSP